MPLPVCACSSSSSDPKAAKHEKFYLLLTISGVPFRVNVRESAISLCGTGKLWATCTEPTVFVGSPFDMDFCHTL